MTKYILAFCATFLIMGNAFALKLAQPSSVASPVLVATPASTSDTSDNDIVAVDVDDTEKWPTTMPVSFSETETYGTWEIVTRENMNAISEAVATAKLRLEDNVFSDGNSVGIGTDEPHEKLRLHVANRIGAPEYCDENAENCFTAQQVYSMVATDNVWQTNGNDFYYNTGNVGIGTSNPQYILHVSSNELPSKIGLYKTYSQDTTDYDRALTIESYPTVEDGVTNNGSNTALRIDVRRTNATDAGALNALVGGEVLYGHLSSLDADAKTTTAYGLQLRPVLQTGEITNIYDLYFDDNVNDNLLTGKHFGIYHGNADATHYFNGRVGIGTSSPRAALEVANGGGIFNGHIVAGAIGAEGGQLVLSAANENISGETSNGWNIDVDNAQNLRFHRGANGEKIRVTADGYVGIGVTNPTRELEVAGTIAADQICDRNGDNCSTPSQLRSVSAGGVPLQAASYQLTGLVPGQRYMVYFQGPVGGTFGPSVRNCSGSVISAANPRYWKGTDRGTNPPHMTHVVAPNDGCIRGYMNGGSNAARYIMAWPI